MIRILAGGLAELKCASVAGMIASSADSHVLSTGLQTDFGPGNEFPGVKIDRLENVGYPNIAAQSELDFRADWKRQKR